MADLTTLANAKQWLGLPEASTDDEALLTRLISSASEFIQTWLNRDIASQDYNEARDGTGGNRLVFAEYPVSAVSSVLVDGRAIPKAENILSVGYRFTDTMIILNGYVFTKGYGNVELSYTAGFASIPLELEQACIELVSLRFKERDRIGHQSKSLAGETVTFFIKDMPDSVLTILRNYRRVVPL